jgi:hypothetical protein
LLGKEIMRAHSEGTTMFASTMPGMANLGEGHAFIDTNISMCVAFKLGGT